MVLGATGLVGSQVVRKLRQRGCRVVAVTRHPRAIDDPGIRWVQADASHWRDVASLPRCSHAVSTLSIWMTADMLPQLMDQGLQRLVAFSSSSAVTKTDASDERERKLAEQLLDGERRLFSLGQASQVTVLRPTLIYGGPGDANVERIAHQLLRFHFFPVVGNGTGLRQPVHVEDLGEAAVAALFASATVGKIFNVAGGEILTVREMVQRVGETHGVSVRLLRVPRRPAEIALAALSRLPKFRRVPSGALERMTRDLTFDNTPANESFGYAPRAFEPPNYRVTC